MSIRQILSLLGFPARRLLRVELSLVMAHRWLPLLLLDVRRPHLLRLQPLEVPLHDSSLGRVRRLELWPH